MDGKSKKARTLASARCVFAFYCLFGLHCMHVGSGDVIVWAGIPTMLPKNLPCLVHLARASEICSTQIPQREAEECT